MVHTKADYIRYGRFAATFAEKVTDFPIGHHNG